MKYSRNMIPSIGLVITLGILLLSTTGAIRSAAAQAQPPAGSTTGSSGTASTSSVNASSTDVEAMSKSDPLTASWLSNLANKATNIIAKVAQTIQTTNDIWSASVSSIDDAQSHRLVTPEGAQLIKEGLNDTQNAAESQSVNMSSIYQKRCSGQTIFPDTFSASWFSNYCGLIKDVGVNYQNLSPDVKGTVGKIINMSKQQQPGTSASSVPNLEQYINMKKYIGGLVAGATIAYSEGAVSGAQNGFENGPIAASIDSQVSASSWWNTFIDIAIKAAPIVISAVG